MAKITFAGVPLLLEDPGFEFQVWLERTLSLHGLTLFGGGGSSDLVEGRQRPRDGDVGLPVPNYSTYQPPEWRINTLWWPTGAGRHAIGLFLASQSQLDQIVAATQSTAAKTLIIDDGTTTRTNAGSVSTTMYLLPPVRVTNVTSAADCWLLCLVDERYFWQFKSTGDLTIDTETTWAQLFTLLGTALGVTINHNTLDAGFGRPDEVELLRKFDNAGLLLDAVAASVGLRVIRRTNGAVDAQFHDTAASSLASRLAISDFLLGGGNAASEPRRTLHPEDVRVIFRKTIGGMVPSLTDGLWEETVAASAVSEGLATSAGESKLFHTSAFANVDADTPSLATNATEVTALAEAIATAFYAWLAGQYDTSWSGVKDLVVNGYDDWVWWHVAYQNRVEHALLQRRDPDQLCDLPIAIRDQDYSTFTRVRSQPANFGVTSQLQQIGDRPEAGGEIIHFELIEDMHLVDPHSLAKPVDNDGNLVTTADDFYVIDQHLKYEGFVAWDNPDTPEPSVPPNERGYRGHARKIIDDYDAGAGPTGKAGYEILSMEGPAQFLFVELYESLQPGTTLCTQLTDDSYPLGHPFNGRSPKITQAPTEFPVGDQYGVAANAKTGDRWIVLYRVDQFGLDGQYQFFVPVASHTTIILGQVVGSVSSGTATFDVDNISLISGVDPRFDTGSATETVTFNNTFSQVYEDNDKIMGWRRADTGNFETDKFSGSGIKIYRFSLAEDKLLADVSTTAIVLGDDGLPVSPTETINVVSNTIQFNGKATYTGADGTTQFGFAGTAIKFTDDYNETGKPGAHVISVDAFMPAIIVELIGNVASEPAMDDINAIYLRGIGTPFATRMPPESDPGLVRVSNAGSSSLADKAKSGEKWLAAYNPDNELYELTEHVDNYPASVILGQVVGQVFPSTATFTVDGVSPIFGPNPGASVTFNNTFGLAYEDNDTIIGFNDTSGNYETERFSEFTPTVVYRFELLSTLSSPAGLTQASARLVDDSGVPLSPEQNIIVVDLLMKFSGPGPYTGADGSSQPGFHGYALAFGVIGGLPAAHIISIESHSATLLVGLLNDVVDYEGNTATPCGLLSYSDASGVTVDAGNLGFGTNFSGRMPETGFSGSGVLVHNSRNQARNAKQGEVWVAVWSQDEARYQFLVPVLQDTDVAIAAVTDAVVPAMALFKASVIEMVRGRFPFETNLTVKNRWRRSYGTSEEIMVMRRTDIDEFGADGEPNNPIWEVVEDNDSTKRQLRFFYFRLFQNKMRADTDALATVLTVFPAGEEDPEQIYLVDFEARFAGLDTYTDIDGNGAAFRGFAVETVSNYNETGLPGCNIVSMDGFAPLLPIKLREDVSGPGAYGALTLEPLLVALGRTWIGSNFCDEGPELSGSGNLIVYNDARLADNAKEGSKWLVGLVQALDVIHYVLICPIDAPAALTRVVSLSHDVPALTGDGGNYQAGVGMGQVLKRIDDNNWINDIEIGEIEVHNMSRTGVGGSLSSPVILRAHLIDGAYVLDNWDMLALPEYSAAEIQIAIHEQFALDFKLKDLAQDHFHYEHDQPNQQFLRHFVAYLDLDDDDVESIATEPCE